jgi:hypothetical protein
MTTPNDSRTVSQRVEGYRVPPDGTDPLDQEDADLRAGRPGRWPNTVVTRFESDQDTSQ